MISHLRRGTAAFYLERGILATKLSWDYEPKGSEPQSQDQRQLAKMTYVQFLGLADIYAFIYA